ncbi:hypothetical protein V2S85_26365 [Novosphingobium resinovorum]|nr:hypothetical protein [Novosphingobium resinovorum]
MLPDVVDGPYYEDRAIMRSDITEGRPGIPLEVRVRIVDPSCRPIRNARVDCWQADAGGIYSNYPYQGDDLKIATIGETFLRGTQVSDEDGMVVFRTIYPGWYRARTAHIHFKVYIGERTRLTTQMFFPDALNEFIYLNVPGYKREAVRDTVNMTDWILTEASHHAMANVREEIDRYIAEMTFGVDPRAMPPVSEKMSCPAEGKCAPAPNTPPAEAKRVELLVPSPANSRLPRAQKPRLRAP